MRDEAGSQERKSWPVFEDGGEKIKVAQYHALHREIAILFRSPNPAAKNSERGCCEFGYHLEELSLMNGSSLVSAAYHS
jgi:hypothetical protein